MTHVIAHPFKPMVGRAHHRVGPFARFEVGIFTALEKAMVLSDVRRELGVSLRANPASIGRKMGARC